MTLSEHSCNKAKKLKEILTPGATVKFRQDLNTYAYDERDITNEIFMSIKFNNEIMQLIRSATYYKELKEGRNKEPGIT